MVTKKLKRKKMLKKMLKEKRERNFEVGGMTSSS